MLFEKLHLKYFFIGSLFMAFFLPPSVSQAQNFKEKIEDYRKHYKEKFLENPRAPIKEEGFPYMRFYDADSTYSVVASFKRTPEALEFQMQTYSGAVRPYIQYGVLSFKLKDTSLQLAVYQNLSLKNAPAFQGYLFIPFKDATNGTVSYGGGRYLEMWEKDIKNGQTILDFNKAYNPYCAYSDGYSCPIPPIENHLTLKIEAGEKIFGKHH